MFAHPLTLFIRLVGVGLAVYSLIYFAQSIYIWVRPGAFYGLHLTGNLLTFVCLIALVFYAMLFGAGLRMIFQTKGIWLQEYTYLQAFLAARLVYLWLESGSVWVTTLAACLVYFGVVYYLQSFIQLAIFQRWFPGAEVRWSKSQDGASRTSALPTTQAREVGTKVGFSTDGRTEYGVTSDQGDRYEFKREPGVNEAWHLSAPVVDPAGVDSVSIEIEVECDQPTIEHANFIDRFVERYASELWAKIEPFVQSTSTEINYELSDLKLTGVSVHLPAMMVVPIEWSIQYSYRTDEDHEFGLIIDFRGEEIVSAGRAD